MADFQWDPAADQTYNGDVNLELSGAPEAFNKKGGKSFTMDASFQSLALTVSGPGTTRWGIEQAPPTHIDVKRGVFKYGGIQTTIEDTFLVFAGLQTSLNVTNDAQFNIFGGTGFIVSHDVFNITIQDRGVVDIGCLQCNLGEVFDDYVNIDISGMGRMAVDATATIDILNGTINVASRPASGYSFALTAISNTSSEGLAIELLNTEINFSGQATGLLKAPMLELSDTRIRVTDTSTLDVRFDTPDFSSGSQFILGLSDLTDGTASAAILIDAYTPGNRPFDFDKCSYPRGLLEFTSGTGGVFMIYLPGRAFDAATMLAQGMIAIDGQPQKDNAKLDFIYGTGPENGHTTIRLKKTS